MKNRKGGNPPMQNGSVFYNRLKFPVITLTLVFGFFTACEQDHVPLDQGLTTRSWQSPDMVLTWNQAIEDLYTFPVGAGYAPPLIARAWSMYHLAMHDALNCITPRYETYVGVPRDKDADPDAAVAQAVYDMLVAVALPGQNLAGMTTLLQTSLA